MRNFRRVSSALVCLCLLLTVCVGCSTPAVAMTVDGVEYSTGEYLANLYNTFYSIYQGSYLYLYESYGMGDPWERQFDYTAGSTTAKMDTATYMKQMAQDNIIRQRAVQKLMEQYGAKLSDEDLKAIEEAMANISESQVLQLGFNKENYRKMLVATGYNEKALFRAIYGKGGPKEVPEEDIRAYFDENYLVYKSIEMSLVDSDGKALSDEKIAEIRTKMEGYLKLYEETGDFNKAIDRYNEDNTTTKAGTTTTTESSKTLNTTTTTETTTAAGGKSTETTAAEGETTTTTGTDSGDGKDDEETKDTNVKEIVAANYSDAKFVEALRTVDEGTAKIVTYKKNDKNDTMALILRMDPEGEGREDYYEKSHDGALQNMKWDDYNKEVTDLALTLTVEVNKRALNMCNPKKFVG